MQDPPPKPRPTTPETLPGTYPMIPGGSQNEIR